MSWGTFTVGLAGDDIIARVNDLDPPGDEIAPHDDQVRAAKEAALLVIRSGSLGDGPAFQVQLSGHSNQDHVPQPNFGPDAITVTVTQVPAEVVGQFDASHRSF
jgi:hypothetical protein